MSGDAETIRPLELLARTAETLGATVCLTATADRFQRHSAGGRVKPHTRMDGSQLSNLVVVRPALRPGTARWDCLARGYVLATAEVIDAVALDDVASLLVEELRRCVAAGRGAAGEDRRGCQAERRVSPHFVRTFVVAPEKPSRRARLRWFVMRHYWWMRGWCSRDGSEVYLRVVDE